jgi:signal transduction histidine kinase
MSWTKRSGGRMRHTQRVLTPEPWSPPSVVDDVPRGGAHFSTWLDRLGIRSPAQRDAAAAGAWTLVSTAVLLLLLGALAASMQIDIQLPQIAVIVGLGAAQCLLLIMRRTHPIACLLSISALQIAFSAALPPEVVLLSAGPIVAAYTVGSLLAPRPLVSVLALSLAMQVMGAIVVSAVGVPAGRDALGFAAAAGQGLVSTGSPALLVIAAASIGAWVAMSRDQQRLISARAAATLEYQAVRTNAAVAAERTRMARELHDIAAHHLSALIVQAGAAERIVDTDPELAKQAIREIRGQGRETLADMRSIVGILRATEGDAPRGDGNAPIPGLQQLEALIGAARTSGDRISWKPSGVAVVLPPLADVTTYRIVQEALANARRHAATVPVTVRMTTTPTRLLLEIENALANKDTAEGELDLSTTGSGAARGDSEQGHGLLGMHERAALVGATLTAGATPDDSWRVRFELPLDDDTPGTEMSVAPTQSGGAG